jgi:NTP pyrophosphatase (non-canonical NTP hydrolase)
MGLSTESGELLDAVKKHYFYGKPLDETNLIEEMGDIFWYLGVLADVLGTTFEEVQRLNILKLQKRYGEKFNKEGALHRDLEAERKILEGQE